MYLSPAAEKSNKINQHKACARAPTNLENHHGKGWCFAASTRVPNVTDEQMVFEIDWNPSATR